MGLRDTFRDIADAIRERGETEAALTPAAMPDAIRAIPAGADVEFIDPDDGVVAPVTSPSYTWQWPEEWPDVVSIYNQYADPAYPNHVLWLLDADRLGFDTSLDSVTAPARTIVVPAYDMSATTAGYARIDRVRFSDGVVVDIPSGTKKSYHTFGGTDRYVWVIAYSNHLDGKYNGIWWRCVGTNNYAWDSACLAIYGGPNSIMTSTSSQLFRYMARLRYVHLGRLEIASNVVFYDVDSLECVDVDDVVIHGNASDMFGECFSMRKVRFGNVRYYPGVAPQQLASFLRGFYNNDVVIDVHMADGMRSPHVGSLHYNCYALTKAIDAFDMSLATDASNMFYNCYSLVHAPAWFNAATATTTASAFAACRVLVDAPTNMRLPSVVNASSMFSGCYRLEAVRGLLVTSKCTALNGFVETARRLTTFTMDDACDTRNVTSFRGMFNACYRLYDVKLVLDFSSATDCQNMFASCYRLMEAPKNITMTKCTNIYGMFQYCRQLTAVENIRISGMTGSAAHLFIGCLSLRHITGSIDLSQATNLADAFPDCFELADLDFLPSLDFSKSTSCQGTFSGCRNITALDGVVTTSVCTSYQSMCSGMRKLRTFSGTLDFSRATSMSSMFSGCGSLASFAYPIVAPVCTTMGNMFDTCTMLTAGPTRVEAAACTSFYYMFNNCANIEAAPAVFDAPNVTDVRTMFAACSKMRTGPTVFNVPKATQLTSMCSGCSSLESWPDMDIRNATMCNSMFSSCYSLRSVGTIQTSSKVTTYNNMFNWCMRLEAVPETLDVSGATDVAYMFSNCRSLRHAPRVIALTKATNPEFMFNNCFALESLPSVLDVSRCTSIRSLFCNCRMLKSLPDVIDSRNCTNVYSYYNTFDNLMSLESMPTHFYGSQKLAGDYTVSFTGCCNMRDKDSLVAMVNNLNDVRNGTRKRTLALGAVLRKLFTADEAADLAATCTSKGWTLTW